MIVAVPGAQFAHPNGVQNGAQIASPRWKAPESIWERSWHPHGAEKNNVEGKKTMLNRSQAVQEEFQAGSQQQIGGVTSLGGEP